jgi:hypothetical protein
VEMEFTLHGFDVYIAEADDRGIDFGFVAAPAEKLWKMMPLIPLLP